MEQTIPKWILTTRPVIPSYAEQPTLKTSKPDVYLRPLRVTDMPDLHELRTQIEVMRNTSVGVVDADLDVTKTWLSRFIIMDDMLQKATDGGEGTVAAKVKTASAGHKSFNFAIVVTQQADADVGSAADKVIGALGCHTIDPEPECGYMIRKEYWGRGIVTAALKAFLDLYWTLERTTVTLPYDPAELKGMKTLPRTQVTPETSEDTVGAREVLTAAIESNNIGSRRIVTKCGFKYSYAETMPDNQRPGEISVEWFLLPRP